MVITDQLAGLAHSNFKKYVHVMPAAAREKGQLTIAWMR